MKKRILSMLLAIVMVVGMMPGASLTAFATDVTAYDLCGGGEQVTSEKLTIGEPANNYDQKYVRIEKEHSHSLAYKYLDDSGHWQECFDTNCPDSNGSKSPLGPHSFDDATDTTCVCGYIRTIEVSVSFDTNGGAAIDPITVTYGEKYGRLPSSAVTGLSGGDSNWYLVDEDGNVTETKITGSSIVSTAINHTLSVVRKVLAPTLKITLEVPGAISDSYQYYVPENSTRILTATVKNENDALLDYTYQWYKDGTAIDGATAAVLTLDGNVSDSGTYKVAVTTKLKANAGIVVTADTASAEKEQKLKIMHAANTLSYDANGGENAPGSHYTGGASITVASDKPSRENHVFAGWNTKADGSGDNYSAGSTFTFANDNGNGGCELALYAQWEECYEIWVGGVQITGANSDDVLGDGGSVKYDPDTNTLTLKDAAIKNTEGSGIYAENINLIINGVDTDADGENTISGTDVTETGVDEEGYEYTAATPGNGIEVQNGSLTIIGELGDITSGESGDGIMVAGDLTIDENSTVGDISAGSDGIYSMGAVTVAGSVGNISAAENGGGNGIGGADDVIISGTVGKISAGYAGLQTIGGNITVSGKIGSITGGNEETGGAGVEAYRKANYDEVTGEYHYTDGNVTITGIVGKITGGAAGIYADGFLTIEDTTVVMVAESGYAFAAGNGYLLGNVIISVPEVYELSSVYVGMDEWYTTIGTSSVTDEGEDVFTPASSVTFEPGYTVSFYDSRVYGYLEQSVPTDKTARQPEVPVCDGYIFGGWYTSSDYGETLDEKYDFTAPVTGNVTLYAKWNHISPPTIAPTYPPVVEGADKGDVVVTPGNPEQGDAVTITLEPDSGYEVDEVVVTDKNGNPVTTVDNGDGTYSYVQPDVKVTISVSYKHIGCAGEAYSDLNPDAWYHEAVDYVLENGLMNGVGDGKFDPNGTTSRAMIVTMLWRLEGEPVVNYLMQFEDVAAESWYTEAVRWAAGEKLVEGWDGKFDPMGEITREQLATILYRYEQYKGGGFTGAWMFLLDYVDRDMVSDWAYEAMCWTTMHDVINGKGDGILDPKGSAKRCEAAQMLMNYLDK